jgi:elongator complex protein 4
LRHSLGVCLITVQKDLLNDLNFLSKITHLSDYVFLIDDSETVKSRLNKTQYEGLFRIHKLPRLNTLNSYLPETLDLAFYIKRKRLIVEMLHLPPDITEDDNDKKGRTTTAVSACSSVGPSKLDF